MPVLTYKQIDDGIDVIVAKQTCPIAGLGDDAWTYLMKFTASFEAATNFLYSNKGVHGVKGPDVSVGIGVSIPNRASVAIEFNRTTFYVKGTNYTQLATLEEVQQDYDTVADMDRNTHKLDDYYAADTTELQPSDVLKNLPKKMSDMLKTNLAFPEFKDFATWPAQARVALASFCYGISPAGYPKFRKALATPDFDTAGLESHVNGWSPNKILAHRKLFWNAARLVESAATSACVDLESLPARFDNGIAVLPLPVPPVKFPPPRAPDTKPP
jgi:hypothetical protein